MYRTRGPGRISGSALIGRCRLVLDAVGAWVASFAIPELSRSTLGSDMEGRYREKTRPVLCWCGLRR